MTSFQNVSISIVLLLFLPISIGGEDKGSDLKGVLSSPKVDPELRRDYERNPSSKQDCMVEMEDQTTKAILDFERTKSTRLDIPRGDVIAGLLDTLRKIAEQAQQELSNYLSRKGLTFVTLWLENNVFIPLLGLDTLIDLVTLFPNIKLIRHPVRARPPTPPPTTPPPPAGETPQSIQQVGGRCSAIKCLGEGVVVAIIDTGVRWTHVELKGNYRSKYGWLEPTLMNNGSQLPRDSLNHGTHVAGIAVGATKGMAPLAQWIGCLGLPPVDDNEWILKKCLEFAFCPCRWNDTNDRDCSMAPHVVVNSWGTPAQEDRKVNYKSFLALKAVGILYVMSAGNDGPACTIVGEPALYDISLAVCSTDKYGTLSYSSSRGPVLSERWDTGSDPNSGTATTPCTTTFHILIKPDICAPGVNINSSMSGSDTAYGLESGTSMATPLVGGVMALMVCANDGVSDNPLDMDSATSLLKNTASRKNIYLEGGRPSEYDFLLADDHVKISNEQCNELFGICNTFPNNLYGYGEVDACEVVKQTIEKAKGEAGLIPQGILPG